MISVSPSVRPSSYIRNLNVGLSSVVIEATFLKLYDYKMITSIKRSHIHIYYY